MLRGFSNVELQPTEKQTVTITLSRYDLSNWDVEKQGWRKPDGEIGVTVGASSRDGRLKGSVPVYSDLRKYCTRSASGKDNRIDRAETCFRRNKMC